MCRGPCSLAYWVDANTPQASLSSEWVAVAVLDGSTCDDKESLRVRQFNKHCAHDGDVIILLSLCKLVGLLLCYLLLLSCPWNAREP